MSGSCNGGVICSSSGNIHITAGENCIFSQSSTGQMQITVLTYYSISCRSPCQDVHICFIRIRIWHSISSKSNIICMTRNSKICIGRTRRIRSRYQPGDVSDDSIRRNIADICRTATKMSNAESCSIECATVKYSYIFSADIISVNVIFSVRSWCAGIGD